MKFAKGGISRVEMRGGGKERGAGRMKGMSFAYIQEFQPRRVGFEGGRLSVCACTCVCVCVGCNEGSLSKFCRDGGKSFARKEVERRRERER